MCGVPPMWLAILLINASAVDESLEVLFIGTFVGGQIALGALEVSGCLLKVVLVGRLGVLLLHFKQPLDGGGSGDLLANWFVRPKVWFRSLLGVHSPVGGVPQ